VRIPEYSAAIGRRLLDLNLPKRTFVILMARDGHCFVPDGGTVLKAHDSLLAFTDQPSFLRLRAILEGRRPPSPPTDSVSEDQPIEVV
jgi:Trk K+ transport system NAD-binding subunit